jgi:predicted NUDIX family NTP pyrophosphohydrolase
MAAISAALCLWRTPPTSGSDGAGFEVLIVHPGGPFWDSKDEGVWSFPKGEFDPKTEPALDAAKREFGEELGVAAPEGEYFDLGEIRQKAGKVVRAWAVSGNVDTTTISSNTFEIEWPPRSGRRQEFPEVDRAEWCSPPLAKRRLNPAQVEFVDRLDKMLDEQR